MLPPVPVMPTGTEINHAHLNALLVWSQELHGTRRAHLEKGAGEKEVAVSVDHALIRTRGDTAALVCGGLPALTGTIDLTKTGLGGLDCGNLQGARWYAVYLVGKDPAGGGVATETGFIASASFSGPALPVGWTHYCLVGRFRTEAEKDQINVMPFKETDGFWQYFSRQTALPLEWVKNPETTDPVELDLKPWLPPFVAQVDAVLYEICGDWGPYEIGLLAPGEKEEIATIIAGAQDSSQSLVRLACPDRTTRYKTTVQPLASKMAPALWIVGFEAAGGGQS